MGRRKRPTATRGTMRYRQDSPAEGSGKSQAGANLRCGAYDALARQLAEAPDAVIDAVVTLVRIRADGASSERYLKNLTSRCRCRAWGIFCSPILLQGSLIELVQQRSDCDSSGNNRHRHHDRFVS